MICNYASTQLKPEFNISVRGASYIEEMQNAYIYIYIFCRHITHKVGKKEECDNSVMLVFSPESELSSSLVRQRESLS